MKASRRVEERRVLPRSTETEPDAANRMDERIGTGAVDLAPQPSDINIDDVCHRIEVQIPDVLQQHATGNHLSDIAHQIFQQLELARKQLDLPPGPVSAVSQQIQFEVADAQNGIFDEDGAAAGQRRDTREHFRKREWFPEIVVTAGT